MATVRLDKVTKVFPGGARALDDISLDVREGEFLVLVRLSGCGKSTVLRIIAGLEEATSGAVSIDGKVVDDIPPKERDVAVVFQNYALYPHMSVRDNLAFSMRIRHGPRSCGSGASSTRPRCSASTSSSTASRRRCPEGSGSGWPPAARSCATRGSCSWTSRCPI